MGSPIKVKDLKKALTKKGMSRDHTHHEIYRKTFAGGTQLITRVSSFDEYDDSLLGEVAKQLALRPKELRELVACPLTEEAWATIVSERCADGVNPWVRFR